MSMKLSGVSTLEQMELKVLKFQHEKLKQRFESRKKVENDLRAKIEQLEKRKMEDDAVINIVNRHWNQLDEDIRILLQRFNGISSNDLELENDLETTSFLSSGKDELDGKLNNRVLVSKRAIAKIMHAFDIFKQRNEKLVRLMKGGLSIDSEDKNIIKNTYIEIQEENNRLHTLNTTLHERCHSLSLKAKELNDRVVMSETKVDEIKNDLEEMYWDKCKLQLRYDKASAQNMEHEQTVKRLEVRFLHESKNEANNGNEKKVGMTMDCEQYTKLQKELEDVKELSNSRLEELEKLHLVHKETLIEMEKQKMRLIHIPEEILMQTPEFKCLQSKFSVIFNNTMQTVSRFDEFKSMFSSMKTQHLVDIDRMEREELQMQIMMKNEMLAIEDVLQHTQKEFKSCTSSCEKNSADNEMLSSVNDEMKKLITSLQSHLKRQKSDIQRYRKKYNALKEANRFRTESNNGNSKVNGCKQTEECFTNEGHKMLPCKRSASDDFLNTKELAVDTKRRMMSTTCVIKEEVNSANAGYTIKEGILDHHRLEKEKKCQLNAEQRKYADKKVVEVQVPPDEDMDRLIKELEKDMDVTGQAYEEMVDQNNRLIATLQQKDLENLTIRGENLKNYQLKNLVKEENVAMAERIETLTKEIHQQLDVMKLMNEKEAFLTKEVSSLEREAQVRQQSMECQKRKLVESVQSSTDLKVHLEKYQSQLKDAQEAILEKTSSLESEKYKTKRLQEDIAAYKKANERLVKIERTGSRDQVLLEEIREYKELLTCNACQVRRKNAVLTKCFHVFCFECLRTRYDTRQRKCPKCNAAFGAKDYHRLFLT